MTQEEKKKTTTACTNLSCVKAKKHVKKCGAFGREYPKREKRKYPFNEFFKKPVCLSDRYYLSAELYLRDEAFDRFQKELGKSFIIDQIHIDRVIYCSQWDWEEERFIGTWWNGANGKESRPAWYVEIKHEKN